MDTSALVREARIRAGLTQAQLAQRAGTSQPTVASYEAGAKVPTVETLARLVTAAGLRLDVSRDEIVAAVTARGMENVRVFGSVARRQDTGASDIDLLVDFDVEGAGLLPLIGFAQDVREIIGRDVDAATLSLLRDEIRAQVEAEAVPL